MRSGSVPCKGLPALGLVLLGMMAFAQAAQADTVTFADPNLEKVVRERIGVPTGPIDSSMLTSVTNLDATYKGITNLGGIENCVNLAVLQLNDNQIVDISLLANLTALTDLFLFDNLIVDVTPLTKLDKLKNLYLQDNSVSDISPFNNHNPGMDNGGTLNLIGNPLNQDALCTYVTALRNRGISVISDSWLKCGKIIVPIPDANLAKAIRDALTKLGLTPTYPDKLLDSDLAQAAFTELDAPGALVTPPPNPNNPVVSDPRIKDLTGIEHCIYLTVLKLDGNRITDISPLSHLGRLQKLYLGGNAIKDLTPLNALYGLYHLELQGQYDYKADGSRTRTLTSFDGIQYLPFVGNPLAPQDPPTLILNDNSISSTSIQISKWITTLAILALGGQQDDAGNPVLATADWLTVLTALVSLDLSNNAIDNDHAKVLSTLTNLTALTIGHQFTLDAKGKETRILSDLSFVQPLTNLLTLDASFNAITDITPVASLSKLISIYVNDNQKVVPSGVVKINNIAALAGLQQLAVVHAENNQISDVSPLIANSLFRVSFTDAPIKPSCVLNVKLNELSRSSLCRDIPILQSDQRRVIVSYDGVCCPESDVFTLTTDVSPLGSGKVDPAGTQECCSGSTKTITATPNSDTVFDHWEGDIGSAPSTEQTIKVVVNANLRITAVFGNPAQSVTLTMAVKGSGTVTPSAGDHLYTSGSSVTVTATPATGWLFDHWEGDLTGNSDPDSIVVDNAKTVTAVFVEQPPSYTLTTHVNGNGSVQLTPAAPQNVYFSGTQVKVVAAPDVGWVFDHWEGDASGTSAQINVVMTKDLSVTAVFRPDGFDFTLALVAQGSGITVPSLGFHRYHKGDAVSVTAIGDPGWVFDHWSGSVSGDDDPLNLVMNSDQTLTAVFIIAPVTYTVTLSVTGQGTVQPAPGTHTYAAGKVLSLQALPNVGWTFDHWEGGLGGSANPASLTVDGNKNIIAVFRQSPYITQVSPASGITLGGDTVSVLGGNLSQVTAVSFDGNAATIIAAADGKVDVSTPAHAHGTVDVTVVAPSGSATIAHGFTYVDPPAAPKIDSITPSQGSAFGNTSVTIRGQQLQFTQSVTFGGIQAPEIDQKDESIVVLKTPSYVAMPPDLAHLPVLPATVDVKLTTSTGSSTSTGGYTYVLAPYVQSITPAEANVSGGDTIVIQGVGLANPASVKFGGVDATVSSSTDKQLTVIDPPHDAGIVDVVIANAGDTYVAAGAFSYFTGAATITLDILDAVTQAPVIDATVTLEPLARTITGSETGQYLFDRLRPGDFILTVQADKCTAQTKQVSVLKDQNVQTQILLDCGSQPQPPCGLQLKRLDSKIVEKSMPLSLTASPASTVASNARLAVRVTSDNALDPKSVWATAQAGPWSATGGEWRPTLAGDDRDGWILLAPGALLPAGQVVTLSVGGATVAGETVGPLSQTFNVAATKEAEPEQPALVEDPSVEPLPALLADVKTPVYRITPAAVFKDPQTVRIPAPDGTALDTLEIYYYSESVIHPGWYRADNVVGWLVPNSRNTVEIDGRNYIEIGVNHAGVFQLGQPGKLALGSAALGSAASVEFGYSGSGALWLSLVSVLLMLSAAVGWLVRGAKTPR